MTPIAFTVNGRAVHASVEPRTHLADFLREHLHLTGTHLGCEQGVCGACTVNIDGVPQRSCIAYAVDCGGSDIRTIEGYDDDSMMAELREAFSAYHALQCGFCTPGMLITSRDIVLRLGEIDDARIREELAGNLCRCTGYVGIVNAVRAVAAGKQPQSAVRASKVQPVAPMPPVAPVAPLPAPAATPPLVAGGQSTLEERITVPAPLDAVWAVLSDPRRVASCLPGATITTFEGEQLAGNMRVGLGPITATFSGRGTLALNDAAHEGRITGQGRDSGSGSLVHAEARFAAREAPQGGGTLVEVGVHWRLSGALAQFSRVGLIEAVARQLAATFGANLEASIAGAAPPSPRKLSLLAVLWAMIRRRLLRR